MNESTCTVDGCANTVLARGWCRRHYARWRRHGDPEAGRTPEGALPEFVRAAAASTGNECLIWPYSTNDKGYGMVRWDGRVQPAHRVVLELVEGSPPEPGMDAAHAPLVCHNPLCVLPLHLRWATKAENQADRALDGTLTRGEAHGRAKLTEAEALAIYRDSRPHREVAAEFGVSQSHVSHIKTGAKWAWLTGEAGR